MEMAMWLDYKPTRELGKWFYGRFATWLWLGVD